MNLPGYPITHDRFGPIQTTSHPQLETQGQIRVSKAWRDLKEAIATLDELMGAIQLRGTHSDEAIKFFTDIYSPRMTESMMVAQKKIEDAVDELCRAMMDVRRDRKLIMPEDIPARSW
jgi:hypothetical protein